MYYAGPVAEGWEDAYVFEDDDDAVTWTLQHCFADNLWGIWCMEGDYPDGIWEIDLYALVFRNNLWKIEPFQSLRAGYL